jgi:hypothetical protein
MAPRQPIGKREASQDAEAMVAGPDLSFKKELERTRHYPPPTHAVRQGRYTRMYVD